MRSIIKAGLIFLVLAGVASPLAAAESGGEVGGPPRERMQPYGPTTIETIQPSDLEKRAREAIEKGECEKGLGFLKRLRKADPYLSDFVLGGLYVIGRCVPANPNKAFELIKEAAENFGSITEPLLGYMYLNGIGTPKNKTKATYWFKKAAYFLALMPPDFRLLFLNTALEYHDVPNELYEEVYWVRDIEEGDPEQLYDSAIRVLNGNGLPKDCKVAYRWMTTAAISKLAEAQYEYGKWFIEGICVEKNVKEGLDWIFRAGEARHLEAQKFLGIWYASKTPSEDTNLKAYYWLHLARSSGAAVEEAFKKVEARMTKKEKGVARIFVERKSAPPP